MLAEKFLLHTDDQGHLIGLPTLPPNEEVEIIVLRKEPIMPFAMTPIESLFGLLKGCGAEFVREKEDREL
jgi:hypothetical protein